jgi:hypothetical protein
VVTRVSPPDETLALEALQQADLDAQINIKAWEAHRERIQAKLRPMVPEGSSIATDSGSCGWELRKGSINYQAMVEFTVGRLRELLGGNYSNADIAGNIRSTIEAVTSDAEFFRKEHSFSFYVRPPLKVAPVPPDTLLADLTASVEALRDRAS